MVTDVDERGRRSAKPDGAGKVVRSMMRNRSRVMSAPLMFFHCIRIDTVPKVELFTGSDVKSRTRFGELSHALQPLAFCATSTDAPPSSLIGEFSPSGPGAPSF